MGINTRLMMNGILTAAGVDAISVAFKAKDFD
jgi:hypothetical protein